MVILPLLLVTFHGNSASEITPVSVEMSSVWTGQHGEWTSLPGSLCIDNNKDTKCHTKGGEMYPWVAVEIPRSRVQQVKITNRVDCCGKRTRGISVYVGDTLPINSRRPYSQGTLLGTFRGPGDKGQLIPFDYPQGLEGKYVIVQKYTRRSREAINLAEIDVFGVSSNTDSCYCGLAQRTKRIVGGQETEVNEYPWQVALWIYNLYGRSEWNHHCGGSVISDQWVLSAAHCTHTFQSYKFKILLGEHNYATDSETDHIEINIDHSQISYHPKYKKTIVNHNYDVLLLKLTSKIDFSSNSHIRPICLPPWRSTKDYDNYIATVTGWGLIDTTNLPDTLQEVNVKVISNTDCSTKYSPSQITESMICAEAEDGNGGKDSCNADSGGPLVIKEPFISESYELIGVVSWGPWPCGHPDEPGVYARVTKVMEWIKNTTMSLNTCPRS